MTTTVDRNLKALCLEILDGDVGSDRFTHLIIETGINLDSIEWNIATKMLGKSDEIFSTLGNKPRTTH